jgi:hypothetical protein
LGRKSSKEITGGTEWYKGLPSPDPSQGRGGPPHFEKKNIKWIASKHNAAIPRCSA